MNQQPIRHHWELEVYQLAFDAAMRIHELVKTFPEEEKYSLTSQIRDASRSVCSNLTEAWRKRRYKAALLNIYVRQHQLGRVYTAETTFQVGASGRKPDTAFVSQARIPENTRQASPVPPDLAIEVVLPSDAFYEVQGKAFEYLDAGTKMVWVVDPVSKTVTVYRSGDVLKTVTRNQTLTGEDVVEGFSCSVAEIFE
mgnify:CR=1 FL=1